MVHDLWLSGSSVRGNVEETLRASDSARELQDELLPECLLSSVETGGKLNSRQLDWVENTLSGVRGNDGESVF